jgi:hypothetical protein
MALENHNCISNILEINTVKNDVQSLKNHEKKFNDSIDRFELVIADLNLTVKIFNEKFKDLPEKVRKLEDRSILSQAIERLVWITVGALAVSFVNQNFVATNKKNEYSIQKDK